MEQVVIVRVKLSAYRDEMPALARRMGEEQLRYNFPEIKDIEILEERGFVDLGHFQDDPDGPGERVAVMEVVCTGEAP